MVGIVRHRQLKGSVTDRSHLNHRATPRLHTCGICSRWCSAGGRSGWASPSSCIPDTCNSDSGTRFVTSSGWAWGSEWSWRVRSGMIGSLAPGKRITHPEDFANVPTSSGASFSRMFTSLKARRAKLLSCQGAMSDNGCVYQDLRITCGWPVTWARPERLHST